jgi:type I restriction enzyme R subunit
MAEAIKDGYILNPLDNIIPVASKMYFDLPDHPLKGFTEPKFKDVDKKQIYENRDRIDAISQYIADLLVKDVYHRIRGTAKAMLAVSSINAAIIYKDRVTKHFQELTKQKKYQKYVDAPIYIVYSDSQDQQKASSLNNGLSEKKVLERFAQEKNGLIIVVAKLQTGFDEKKLHTLFLDKEVKGIAAIQTISRVDRTTKYKNECKIVDFSYNNVNVQNIKEAFEHYSNVVVSDFDPLSDKRVLEILYNDLRKSDITTTFFPIFTSIYKDEAKRDNPHSYLDLESKLEAYIHAHPKRTADSKAKAAQYFTILNRIEYVIIIEDKYSEKTFLHFLRKFNSLYNLLHRSEIEKDPIEVYFDNQIGIIEVEGYQAQEKKQRELKIAEGKVPGYSIRQLSILDIIEARNENEELIGVLIQEFKTKMDDFFSYVRESKEGERLIVKIKSQVSEDEIYEDFGKIYRKYRALYRKKVGNYFFEETKDMVEKLCDEFEETI